MDMEIPALYSVFKGGEVKAAPVRFDGLKIVFESEPVKPAYTAEEHSERRPIIVIDVKGLEKRDLDNKLLKKIEFRGSDAWYLTHIYDVDDVFDCFMGNIVKLLIPYHTTKNDAVLKEVHEISDNCIPVIFVMKGTAVVRKGRSGDFMKLLREIDRVGFQYIMMIDTDRSLSEDDWVIVNNSYSNVIRLVGETATLPERQDRTITS